MLQNQGLGLGLGLKIRVPVVNVRVRVKGFKWKLGGVRCLFSSLIGVNPLICSSGVIR